MALSRHDVWGHFAPMFHLVDVFAVYAITLVGGRHVTLPAFDAREALLAIGAPHREWGLSGCKVALRKGAVRVRCVRGHTDTDGWVARCRQAGLQAAPLAFGGWWCE